MINIALAGDHALNLHALATLLQQQSGFRIVSISKDAGQLSSSLTLGGKDHYPHLVLLDINFDLHRSAGMISFLKGTHPTIRLAALGLTRDRAAILRLQQMGVDSYIPKNSDPDQLEHTLKQIVLKGHCDIALPEQGFDDSMAGMAAKEGAATLTAWPSVTTNERRFFRLAMSEASNEDIRRRMKLCESTFERLVAKVYRHFGVSSRNGLVLALYRNRFVIMDDL
jgi:DNA-binding NarL/FixJ family response regulator